MTDGVPEQVSACCNELTALAEKTAEHAGRLIRLYKDHYAPTYDEFRSGLPSEEWRTLVYPRVVRSSVLLEARCIQVHGLEYYSATGYTTAAFFFPFDALRSLEDFRAYLKASWHLFTVEKMGWPDLDLLRAWRDIDLTRES